jgi:hypothetical protein
MSLIERARFLASGQNDSHSVTIEELCAELEANAAEIGRKDTMLIEAHDTLTEIYYGSMPPQRRNELTRELIAKIDAALNKQESDNV